jgi:hypothetical protein
MSTSRAREKAKLERMKADYLMEPTNLVERVKQRRAERWLVNYAVGPVGSTLYDTRKLSDKARSRWRLWRAAKRGDPVAIELSESAPELAGPPFD